MKNPLRILVTRPSPQGEALCATLKAAGHTPIFFPTIEIKPLPPQSIRAQLTQLNHPDWFIFISRPAVTLSAPLIHHQWPQLPTTLKIAAVGEGTAQALHQAKLPVTVCPSQWNSEGLLALPEFQAISRKHLAIFCGIGGRELLASTLTTRGAQVTVIPIYERTLPTQDPAPIQDLINKGQLDAILCTSVQSLAHLQQLLRSENLQKIPLVLVSERIMIQAKEQGFTTCILAQDASHEAILHALLTIRN